MSDTEVRPDVTALTVQLLSAYLANNTVASDELANLVRTTKSALTEEVAPASTPAVEEVHTPAVTPRKSLASPDHILSLIDGKPYKTLKRHLAGHGLTPEAYRERYNLPATYPMVAPNFAAKRREIAQQIGLGVRRTPATAKVEAAKQPDVVAKSVSEASPNEPPIEKKAAKAAKPTPASPGRSRAKAAPATAPATETPKANAEPEKPAEKRAGPVSRKPADRVRKSVKRDPKAKPSAIVDAGVATGAESAPADRAKPKRGAGAKVVSATPKPAARSRKKATVPVAGPEAKPAPAAAEGTRPARRAKLGLFSGNVASSTDDVNLTVNAGVAASKPEPARNAPKAKRMARTPTSDPQE